MGCLNFVKDGVIKLPPGFRFQPTDEEIVFQYLLRKTFCCPLPASIIPEINVCKHDPWDLPGDLEQDRYFFSNKEAKYRNGNRTNRATDAGYWKATGVDKQIVSSKKKPLVGLRKTLVFYKGKAPHGSRTDWIMHEYRLILTGKTASCSQQATKSSQSSCVQLGNWVLCHIFLKKGGTKAVDDELVQICKNNNDIVRMDQSRFENFTIGNLSEIGPVAFAFDARGKGPYTGVADGRILKYQGPNVGFVDYATTSPLRTKQQCDGTNGTAAATCGRPVGLGFLLLTNELYVVSFNFGFLVVPPNGGLATQIATGFNGTPFAFPDALDIDQARQIVYFTDSGSIIATMNISQIIQSNDNSGKLYKYDIKTKKLSLLLSGLFGPAGVAVSASGEYLLFSEFIRRRIQKYWVKGPLAGSSEILVNLPGSPDDIKRTALGDFWAAVNIVDPQTFQITSTVGKRITGSGKIKATVNLTAQYAGRLVTEVQEYSGKLYVGSLQADFVGIYGI